MKRENQGRLFVLEGGDGTGKTTQAGKLCAFLAEGGGNPLHLREPGSTVLGERIRALLLEGPGMKGEEISPAAEVFLYMAARAQLVKERILPALEEGRIVVLERFFYSTYAYQGAGLGTDRDMILEMGEWAAGSAKPTRVVLLDMDPGESSFRLPVRRDRIESRDIAYHRRVRQGFLELAMRFKDLFRVVDARGTPAEVHERVLGVLRDAL